MKRPSSQRLQVHARTPTMHPIVHMRAQCNALRSCPPNPSQGVLSCSPTPSRGPPRRSSTSDTGGCSVSSRRLGDCSRWFSSSDQQDELSPADEWIQKATIEQSGGVGAGPGKRMCSPIPRRSIRARGARCAASSYRRQQEDTCSRSGEHACQGTGRIGSSSAQPYCGAKSTARCSQAAHLELPSLCSRCTNLGAILVHRRIPYS